MAEGGGADGRNRQAIPHKCALVVVEQGEEGVACAGQGDGADEVVSGRGLALVGLAGRAPVGQGTGAPVGGLAVGQGGIVQAKAVAEAVGFGRPRE